MLDVILGEDIYNVAAVVTRYCLAFLYDDAGIRSVNWLLQFQPTACITLDQIPVDLQRAQLSQLRIRRFYEHSGILT